MDPKENKRLKELVMELANTINSVFSENPQIKETLRDIEKEGYQVDLILASITRILRRDDKVKEELKFEFNAFDRAFLQSLKLKLD